MLQNHFRHIPEHLQLLVVAARHAVLRRVLSGTITGHAADFDSVVKASSASTCFSQLLLGDGGYISASRGSLVGTGTSFGREPTFYSSANWMLFRQHVMKVSGIMLYHHTHGCARVCVVQHMCFRVLSPFSGLRQRVQPVVTHTCGAYGTQTFGTFILDGASKHICNPLSYSSLGMLLRQHAMKVSGTCCI